MIPLSTVNIGGGDTQTLLISFKKIERFALSGGRDTKTSAASPHTTAIALAPNKQPGGISTILFL